MCDLDRKYPTYAPITGPLDRREQAAFDYAKKVAAKINQILGVGTPQQPAWWLWTEPRVSRGPFIGGPPPGDDYIPMPEVVIYEDTDWLSQRYGWDTFAWPSIALNRRIDAGPRPRLAFDRNSPYERDTGVWPMFGHSTRATIRAALARTSGKMLEDLYAARPYSVEYANRRVSLGPSEPEVEVQEDEVYIGDWNG